MNESQPLTDQLANISPLFVVGAVLVFTLVRLVLVKVRDGWARSISETCDTINFVLVLAFLTIRPFVAQAFYIPSESMERTLLKGDRLVVDKVTYRFSQPARGDVIVFEAPPNATNNQTGVDFIKRCVAIPGDTIEMRAPRILVDGESLDTVGGFGYEAHEYLRRQLDLGEGSVKFFKDHLLINGAVRMEPAELATKIGRAGAKISIEPGQTLINGQVLTEDFTREDPDYDHGPVVLGPGEYYMLGDNRNRSQDSHRWGPLERNRMVGRARFVFWPPLRMGIIR
ncbi:MAG: signal peptidase I [Armatimonadota bacterium]